MYGVGLPYAVHVLLQLAQLPYLLSSGKGLFWRPSIGWDARRESGSELHTTGSCNSIEVKSCDIHMRVEHASDISSSNNDPIVRVSHATLPALLHKPRSAWLHGG